MKETLVMFTNSFPFGNEESFLVAELNHLSKRFKRVIIIPSQGGESQRIVPKNVEIVPLFINKKPKRLSSTLIKNPVAALNIYFWTMLQKGNYSPYLKYYKSFLHYLWSDLSRYSALKKLIKKRQLHNAIFYDYWFVNFTISLALLRKKNIIKTFICRAHGFDLYDERQFECRVPFRDFKIKYLDKVYVVSAKGGDYLKSKIHLKYIDKVAVSYLGVTSMSAEIPNNQKREEVPLLVSCSHMIQLKRVEMIPLVLSLTGKPLRWVHFGKGMTYHLIKENARSLKHGSYQLMGEVDNETVRRFYLENHVDLFISLSESEGIPVSMMEAISHGIPILSTAVGGVHEIVNKVTGILVSPQSNANEIAHQLNYILNNLHTFDRNKIKNYHVKNFNSKTNYTSFIDDVLSLR